MPYKDPEVRKIFKREWIRKYRATSLGREMSKVLQRESRKRHPEAERARAKRYQIKNKDKVAEYHKNSYYHLRKEMLTNYSDGKLDCRCCGESNYDFLTLDHLNGGGSKHRRIIGASNLPNYLKKNNYPPGYQVLCYNCNCGRQRNKGICPHKLIK